ncbi:MAG: hypothetical protein ONB42_10920 [candidate division KSB1 bacterium]|nr:hypothetical protein [candidate division KSB1 bacterium]
MPGFFVIAMELLLQLRKIFFIFQGVGQNQRLIGQRTWIAVIL